MAPAGPLLEVPTRKSPRLAGASRFAERLRCLCSSAFKRSRPLLIARCSAENRTGATGRFLASDVYGPWQRVIAICDVGIAGCSRLLVICPVVCSELDSSDCALIERSLPPSTPTEPPKKPAPKKKAKTNEDEPEARPLSLARRRSLVAPATTPFGTLTETYEVDRVLASRAGRASLEYLVRWRGWLTCGDTWEPAIHLPEEVIAAFQSVPRLLACPHLLLRFVREAVARRLSSRKKLERLPAFEVDIEIDALKEPGLGKGMLEVISKLTTPPTSIDFDSEFNSTSQAYSVFVDQPAAIADVIALHAVRPGLGFGNLRINCGAASYEDMAYVIPPLEVYFKQPKPSFGALPLGGAMSFHLKLSYAVINGKTGMMNYPAIADRAAAFTLAERAALCEHAKSMLAQEWSAKPVQHGLRTKGWHRLPKGVPVLPLHVAIPK